jgi:hypothetical protein
MQHLDLGDHSVEFATQEVGRRGFCSTARGVDRRVLAGGAYGGAKIVPWHGCLGLTRGAELIQCRNQRYPESLEISAERCRGRSRIDEGIQAERHALERDRRPHRRLQCGWIAAELGDRMLHRGLQIGDVETRLTPGGFN